MRGPAEKRTFPRKKLDLDFHLIITGKRIPAVMIDYSLSGMGILIKDRADLSSPILDLRIDDIHLNASGKIVWRQEMLPGIKVGISRIGDLEGRLSSYRFADIVMGLQRAFKTGVLHITTSEWSKKIFFRNGEMVFSASNIESEQLGSILLSSGRISPQQHQSALSSALEKRKSYGSMLVEMQYLAPQVLISAVHQKAEAIIMNVCGVEDAHFSFREQALPKEEVLALKLNAYDLLYRGSTNADRFDRLRELHFPTGSQIVLSPEISSILDRLHLEDRARQVLSLINGRMSLKDVLLHSPFREEETLRIIFGLFNAHVLDVDTTRDERAAGGEEKKPEPQRPAIDPEIYLKIARLHREHKSLGYHGVLGLQRNASAAEVKRAYHALAKEYHPDRYLHVQSESLKEQLNVIFAYINEAYRVLSREGGSGPQEQKTARQEGPGRPTDQKGLARMKYREGRDWLMSRDYEQAMTLFGQAVYLDDTIPDYHYYYGIALIRNRKIKEAEASIRKALHLSPDNADYVTELGNIYLKLGFRTRAKNAFDKALKLDPFHPQATEGLKKSLELQ